MYKRMITKIAPILNLMLIIVGCDSSNNFPTESNEILSLSKAETGYAFSNTGTAEPVCVDAVKYAEYNYTLWAGQTNDAGTVTISNDDNNIYVTYNTNSTADLSEVHVYVWTDVNNIPTKRPAPGHADYKVENINADSYTVVIPAVINCDDVYYISAHASLKEDDNSDIDEAGSGNNAGETAYGAGANYPNGFPKGKGAWWGYMTFSVYCCDITPKPECQTETAWGGSTAGNGPAWWFYFDTEGASTQPIYAGKKLTDGSVTYNSITGTLNIDLGSWELQNVGESVKVEGYSEANLPTGFNARPAAGLFTLYKGNALTINGNGSRYYAIHLDVQLCK